jgi:hypothetical protein
VRAEEAPGGDDSEWRVTAMISFGPTFLRSCAPRVGARVAAWRAAAGGQMGAEEGTGKERIGNRLSPARPFRDIRHPLI